MVYIVVSDEPPELQGVEYYKLGGKYLVVAGYTVGEKTGLEAGRRRVYWLPGRQALSSAIRSLRRLLKQCEEIVDVAVGEEVCRWPEREEPVGVDGGVWVFYWKRKGCGEGYNVYVEKTGLVLSVKVGST